MKLITKCIGAVALALALAVPFDAAKANVIISNLTLTEYSISFDIDGTLPATAPADSPHIFYIVNPDQSESPGFALGDFTNGSPYFEGDQVAFRTFTGGADFGDYMLIYFDSDLAPGESISGTFYGNWGTPIFDPTQVTSLNFYWGADDPISPSLTGGTFLGSVAIVPEPTSAALLLLGGCVALARPRRRK